jgi:hypothetical protein
MKIQLSLCLVALFAVLIAAQQHDQFHGQYWMPCMPFGQGIDMYARNFVILTNSGYFSRIQLYVSDPQCAKVCIGHLALPLTLRVCL